MSRTVPWHAPSEAVYHNNTLCSGGRAANIAGAGESSSGRRLCAECAQLNQMSSRALAPPPETVRRPI